MGNELSLTHLVLGASTLVQLVMLLLLLASIFSWTVIFQKWSVLKRARAGADHFEQRFWSGIELGEMYRNIAARPDKASGMERIFEAGFREYARLRKQERAENGEVLEGAQRSMRVAVSREMDRLENHLSFLATVGSTSPYVGLFGTVWGIMNAFMALGGVQQATISSVAPGIAEALIATAMGLFAAIPAVIAYNRYANDVERLANQYDTFMDEFSSILHRQGSG